MPNTTPKTPLVSVIMAVYNLSNYIEAAIYSVQAQSYQNWELLVIDDGSTDDTPEKIEKLASFSTRLRIFRHSNNKGVSAARNLGLAQMRGSWFCFLDGDDALTEDSLLLRLKSYAQNEDVWFVDGTVLEYDADMREIQGIWRPNACVGSPLRALLSLNSGVFGYPSWLIRKRALGDKLRLCEDMSHAEDLHFYASLAAGGGQWAAVPDPVLKHRQHLQSAMHNLNGLADGYNTFYTKLKNSHRNRQSLWAWYRLWWRIKRIMCLSFLKRRQFLAAFRFAILQRY